MGSSFWHSGGCYPPLQSPRYSARSLVKEKKIFHDVLFEDRLKPPVGGIPSARALPFALPHVLASHSVSRALR